MLAIIYLALMIAFGDAICRRLYAFRSLPVRFAAATLSGMLFSTWITYCGAWVFSGSSSPMLFGNVVFLIIAGATIFLTNKYFPARDTDATPDEIGEFVGGDWAMFGAISLLVIWMMFSSMNMSDGKLLISHHQWSDFGSNVSIMQSFALGHNFPTEYPHFSGERIRYHFLFYFQAGNLEYLGFNPAFANNILSILGLISTLILSWALGVVVFGSRAVGRIAALLFFFHGSLAFIPYILAKGSFSAVWTSLWTTQDFLSSGFGYRGEDWGVWSQVVYLNQRHFASSIGIVLLVLVFLMVRYRRSLASATTFPAEPALGVADEPYSDDDAEPDGIEHGADPENDVELADASAHDETPTPVSTIETRADDNLVRDADETSTEEQEGDDIQAAGSDTAEEVDDPDLTEAHQPSHSAENTVDWRERLLGSGPWYQGFLDDPKPYIFSGVLLGLLPMWNGPVFLAAAVVLGILLLALPLRPSLLITGAVSALIALPQVMYLRGGDMRVPGYSLFHWGYTLSEPSIVNTIKYIAFTFGFKWVLIAIALYYGSRLSRVLFIAFFALIWIAFCFQFSEEVLANHKFLNIFLVGGNVFAAYGLYKLWHVTIGALRIPARALAAILFVLITIGGVIDLFPIHNAYWMELPFYGDPLVTWLEKNTDPRSIFLSYRYVNHRILLAGRKLFYGHPYYSWSAGYDTEARDRLYRRMFEDTDANAVFSLLKANHISYVAIDDQMRVEHDLVKTLNEPLFAGYCDVVYDDTENKAGKLKIYKVPDVLGQPKGPIPSPTPRADEINVSGTQPTPDWSANGNGPTGNPRGIAVDGKGTIYVTETDNGRIQKFDREGKLVTSFGTPGTGAGELKEPNGIAVDAKGNIFVSDTANSKIVKFGPDGKFVKEWPGPDDKFYGVRDITFAPNGNLYILDQGHGRVVVFDPAKETFRTVFGTGGGTAPGQFQQATGLGIGGGQVFVTDSGNDRVQVFDLDGNFVRQFEVPKWAAYIWHYPDIAYDEPTNKLFITSGWTHEILVYDMAGNQISNISTTTDSKLENPSSIVVDRSGDKPRLLVLDTGSGRIRIFTTAAF